MSTIQHPDRTCSGRQTTSVDSPISSSIELIIIIIEIIRTTKTAFDVAGSAWRAGAAPNFSLVKFNGGKALATDRMIGKAAETGLFRVIDNLESPAHFIQQKKNADLRRPAIAVRVSTWTGEALQETLAFFLSFWGYMCQPDIPGQKMRTRVYEGNETIPGTNSVFGVMACARQHQNRQEFTASKLVFLAGCARAHNYRCKG